MTQYSYGVEDLANGTTLTTANSGFPSLTIGTGSTLTASTDHAHMGTKSIKMVMVASQITRVVPRFGSEGNIPIGAGRYYIWLNQAFNATIEHLVWRTVAGVSTAWPGNVNTSSKLTTSAGTFTNAYPIGAWVRVEYGFNATAGTGWVDLYNGDSLDPIETKAASVATAGNLPGAWYLGKSSAGAQVGTIYYDDILLVSGSDDRIGPALSLPGVRDFGVGSSTVDKMMLGDKLVWQK